MRADRQAKAETRVRKYWLTVLAVMLTGAADAAPQDNRAACAAVRVTPACIHATPSVPAPDAVPTASASPPTPGGWPRLRLLDPVGRLAARKALDLAWHRLAETDCAEVLTAFTDRTGRLLGDRLRALDVDLPTYLTMVVFIDGSRETPCVTGVFAFMAPGSRVVRLCVDEIKRTWQQDPEHTLASFIHEMLHTLGLNENPPSSAEITGRVLAGCRHRR